MIVLDTSALMAIAGREPEGPRCAERLLGEDVIVISAGTLAEASIVAARRGLSEEMARLLEELRCEVEPVTQASALRVAGAYDRWGKGIHRARLNMGDCFAYEVADRLGCQLLYIGNDFAKMDVASAL